MIVYITRFALSRGILEVNAEPVCGSVLKYRIDDKPPTQFVKGEGVDWHRTRKGAQMRADTMRIQKINNLKKHIKRFQKMVF